MPGYHSTTPKCKTFLPTYTLQMLYNTLILPHFNYCCLVWGRAAQNRLHKVITLQKRAIRICTKAQPREHCEPLFRKLDTLPLMKLISFKTGLFMYKYSHNLLPSIFSNCFVKQSNIHSKHTRRNNDYRPPLFRTSFSQNQSIKHHGVNIWNNLENSFKVKNISFSRFKKIYKLSLL